MITVLFARKDSIYKSFPDLDVYDIFRDARTWRGGNSVIAHPPCRAWGQLRHFAKPRADEKQLAQFSVDLIRKYGGVLEHPARSTLWQAAGLPPPGKFDAFGGFTFPIFQSHFGHRAEKKTFLYIVGMNPRHLPAIPFSLAPASHVCETRKRDGRPSIRKSEREQTPVDLALWLVSVAKLCEVS